MARHGESAVQLYVEHLQEELDTADATDTDTDATDTGGEVVLDYTIGEDLTQYVIAVTLGVDAAVRTIAMES